MLPRARRSGRAPPLCGAFGRREAPGGAPGALYGALSPALRRRCSPSSWWHRGTGGAPGSGRGRIVRPPSWCGASVRRSPGARRGPPPDRPPAGGAPRRPSSARRCSPGRAVPGALSAAPGGGRHRAGARRAPPAGSVRRAGPLRAPPARNRTRAASAVVGTGGALGPAAAAFRRCLGAHRRAPGSGRGRMVRRRPLLPVEALTGRALRRSPFVRPPRPVALPGGVGGDSRRPISAGSTG